MAAATGTGLVSKRVLALSAGQISYLERGEPRPGAPSVVLVHGMMGTAATFRLLIEALDPDVHVVALDLPGAGKSERSDRVSATLHSMSRCVSEALQALGLTAPMLVGHSHGGAVALHLAATEPGRVCGLVLLAPAHPFSGHADPLIRFYLSPLGWAFAHTMPWYPKRVQMIWLRYMTGPQAQDTVERLMPYRENLRVRGTVAFLLRVLRSWHTDMGNLRRLLDTPLRTPTLLVWGDYDGAVPVSTARELQTRLEFSELEVLAGIGHLPAEEAPQRCAELIQRWCLQCSGDGRAISVAD